MSKRILKSMSAASPVPSVSSTQRHVVRQASPPRMIRPQAPPLFSQAQSAAFIIH